MKLLRDFFRLRAPRRSLFVVRREAQRRDFVVTVPPPLAAPANDAQRQARVAAPLPSPRHLQLVSSH